MSSEKRCAFCTRPATDLIGVRVRGRETFAFCGEPCRTRWLLREAEPVAGGDLADVERMIRQECDSLSDMLAEKNRAYGNSALVPLRVFSRADSEEQIRVRIDDKLSRLARGQAAGEDVELDLLGYLILLRIARRLRSPPADAKIHATRDGQGTVCGESITRDTIYRSTEFFASAILDGRGCRVCTSALARSPEAEADGSGVGGCSGSGVRYSSETPADLSRGSEVSP